MAKILAIESSCDETSAAVCKDGFIYSNITRSQQIHKMYGGVVPELASRAHLEAIVPVVDEALKVSGCTLDEMDAFAFTQSPGLIGSLIVGAGFAKSLSLAKNKPLIAVQHLHAHVLANLIRKGAETPIPEFPYLCLTVSGGHTQIVICHSPYQLEVIGQTLDDAAGEAFDKAAKMLGLPYPGGPLIDKYAAQGQPKFDFPEPKIEALNFSFSGLKTAIRYFLRDNQLKDENFVQKNLNDVCASIQDRIISILLNKLKMAVDQTGIKDVCIAGGVSANKGLRKRFAELGEEEGWRTFIPAFQYCTDNAGMIAMAGYFKYLNKEFSPLSVIPSAKVI